MLDHKPSLEFFDGAKPSDRFLRDIKIFLNFDGPRKREIIQKALEWYAEHDLSEKLDDWLDGETDKAKEQTVRAFHLILFFSSVAILKRLSDDQFLNELLKLDFPEQLIQYIIDTKNKYKSEIISKIARESENIITGFKDLHWRIDVKRSDKYFKTTDVPILLLKLSFMNDDINDVLFEMSHDEVISFMRELAIAEAEMSRINGGEKDA